MQTHATNHARSIMKLRRKVELLSRNHRDGKNIFRIIFLFRFWAGWES